jgi:hypothetical protein
MWRSKRSTSSFERQCRLGRDVVRLRRVGIRLRRRLPLDVGGIERDRRGRREVTGERGISGQDPAGEVHTARGQRVVGNLLGPQTRREDVIPGLLAGFDQTEARRLADRTADRDRRPRLPVAL